MALTRGSLEQALRYFNERQVRQLADLIIQFLEQRQIEAVVEVVSEVAGIKVSTLNPIRTSVGVLNDLIAAGFSVASRSSCRDIVVCAPDQEQGLTLDFCSRDSELVL